MTVTYHLERVEEDGTIAVELADALLVTCIDCTSPRETVEEALVSAGLPVWRCAAGSAWDSQDEWRPDAEG